MFNLFRKRPYRNFASYRRAWDSAFKKDPPVPLNIDLELAALCNLRCPFCFITDKSHRSFMNHKPELIQYMDINLAKKVIDQASKMGVPALKFNWRGEGTLHPHFSRIVEYARDKKTFFELLVNTNGNVQVRALRGLLLATKVMVSIDSMRPETYKIMRVGGDLDCVIRTITQLILNGHDNVWVRRVITKENEHENFQEDVKHVFGSAVKVSESKCFDLRNEDYARDHDITANSPDAVKVCYRRQYCGYPSQRLVVGYDGNVMPCCVDLKETMVLGNLKTHTLRDIWDGPILEHIREFLRADKMPSDACKNCVSWMAYKL